MTRDEKVSNQNTIFLWNMFPNTGKRWWINDKNIETGFICFTHAIDERQTIEFIIIDEFNAIELSGFVPWWARWKRPNECFLKAETISA